MGEPAMVLEAARERLKKLGPLATRLNRASDRYTEELKTIEAELNALNLGLCVTEDNEPLLVSTAREETNDQGQVTGVYQIAHYLAYERHNNDWKLVVHREKEWMQGENCDDVSHWTREDTTPLLECSREIRLASADHILTLLAHLHVKAEEKIASLQKVMDARK